MKDIIAYYKGHQGDTLLIRTSDVSKLNILKEVFNNLSKNKINTYSFKNMTGFIFHDVEDVIQHNDRNYIKIGFKNGIINWSQNTDHI